MASKKDRLGKAARSQVDRSIGDQSATPAPQDLGEFVRDVQQKRQPETKASAEASAAAESPKAPSPPETPPPADRHEGADRPEIDLPQAGDQRPFTASWRRAPGRSMARSRESIYNVSSDIRLEDYTEAGGGGGGSGGWIRIGGGILGLAVLVYALFLLWGWLTGPSYHLAISNELIDDAQVEDLDDEKHPIVSSGSPVYIRFDWGDDELETDYLKITITRGGEEGQPEAELGRRPPVSANYIYFMGPLDAGEYNIVVTDRGGDALREKTFTVR